MKRNFAEVQGQMINRDNLDLHTTQGLVDLAIEVE